jgi:glycosyltransferase involved in cell wall biosynthesis
VRGEFPEVRFALVGTETLGEPGFEARLRARALELGLSEGKMAFLGHRTDIPELTASFDIAVVPSYEEAFGNVVLEAMASGVPTIATNAGGPSDIIKHGESGMLIEPRSADSLAAALASCLREPQMAASLGHRGREVAVDRYANAKVMAEIEGLL